MKGLTLGLFPPCRRKVIEFPRRENEFGPDSARVKCEDQSGLGKLSEGRSLRSSGLKLFCCKQVAYAMTCESQYFGLLSYLMKNCCDYFSMYICSLNLLYFYIELRLNSIDLQSVVNLFQLAIVHVYMSLGF